MRRFFICNALLEAAWIIRPQKFLFYFVFVVFVAFFWILFPFILFFRWGEGWWYLLLFYFCFVCFFYLCLFYFFFFFLSFVFSDFVFGFKWICFLLLYLFLCVFFFSVAVSSCRILSLIYTGIGSRLYDPGNFVV